MVDFHPIDTKPSRQCCRCDHEFTADEVQGGYGWTPLRSGWRCPDCTRAYRTRVDALVDAFLANHQSRGWVAISEHREYEECVFCDVLATATARLLSAPERQRR
jgi:hypothetical protein